MSAIGEPPDTPPRWLADREIELRDALNVTKPVLDSEDLIRAVAGDYEQHAGSCEPAMADWCRARAGQLRTCLAHVQEGTSRA